ERDIRRRERSERIVHAPLPPARWRVPGNVLRVPRCEPFARRSRARTLMHIPDGFIDAPVSLGAGVVAAGGVAVSLRRAGQATLESRAARTGLVAAFIFAAQMLNFPVASGTSGHLLGGLLAAVLVGPWLGSLAVSIVLTVQCLLFADGGVSALGLNIVNMAII